MARTLLIALFTFCLASAGAMAETPQRWLHVHVDEEGPDGERVRINMPLELIASVLPLIEADEYHRGKIHLEMDDFEDVDLRALVASLRKAEDGEYVTVQSRDSDVSIKKRGDQLLIHVDEDDEKVDIEVRFAVVDALFSGAEGEIDLLAAVAALDKEGNVELVRVISEDETVRIWIDENNLSE